MRLRLSLALVSICHLLCSCSPKPPSDPVLEKAEQGDAAAQLQWAERSLANQDLAEARAWLERASKSGFAPAKRRLAILQTQATWDDLPIGEAIETLEALSTDDGASAAYLAELFENGPADYHDPAKALDFHRRAAELGVPYSKYKVALARWTANSETLGSNEIREIGDLAYEIGKSSEPRALSLYARILDAARREASADPHHLAAAKAGEPYSLYRAGIAYHRSVRDPTFGPLGFEYLTKAEQAGVTQAVMALARAYYQGNGVLTDKDKGLKLSTLAAWLGDAEAIEFVVTRAVRSENAWDLDTRVEMSALAKHRELKNEILSQHIRLNVGISGHVFTRLVQNRIELRMSELSGHLESRRERNAPKPPPEAALATHDPLAPYVEDAEAAGIALLTADKNKLMELGLAFLDPDSPRHDPAEGILWIKDAQNAGSPEAGLKLYQLYIADPGSTLVTEEQAMLGLQRATVDPHPTASLMLAREFLSGQRLPRSPGLALRAAEAAEQAGDPGARPLIKEIVGGLEAVDMRTPIIREIVAELAQEGGADFRFIAAAYQVHDYLLKRLAKGPSPDSSDRRIFPYQPLFGRIRNHSRIAYPSTFTRHAFDSLASYHQLWQAPFFRLKNEEQLEPEIESAVNEIFALADEGYPRALEVAAMWSLKGYFVETDAAKAAAYLESAPESSQTREILLELGFAYLDGFSIDYNIERASLLLRRAAEAGHENAASLFSDLDRISDNDSPDIQREQSYTLIDLAYRASSLKQPAAMYLLARTLEDNDAFSEAYRKHEYRRWIEEAAKLENFDALLAIGLNYIEGKHVEKNPLRGTRFFKHAADLGSPEAQYLYGFHLATGIEVKQDLAEGIRYLELAAAQDEPQAARLLENLRATTRDETLAQVESRDVLSQILESAQGHDTFPIQPYFEQQGRLYPVVGTKGIRPQIATDDGVANSDRDKKPFLLAGDAFHPAHVTLDSIEIVGPVMFQNDAIIFTGKRPQVHLSFTVDSALSNAYAALLIKDRSRIASYAWKQLGQVAPGKSTRVSFAYDEAFLTYADIALYFFEGGKEVPSNVRQQPQHFLDSRLASFPELRRGYVEKNAGLDAEAKLTKDFTSFVNGVIYLPEATDTTFHLNEFGYVSYAELPAGLRRDATDQIIDALPYLSFYPKLEKGKPVPSTVTLPLE